MDCTREVEGEGRGKGSEGWREGERERVSGKDREWEEGRILLRKLAFTAVNVYDRCELQDGYY
jgi:hypothetical protein